MKRSRVEPGLFPRKKGEQGLYPLWAKRQRIRRENTPDEEIYIPQIPQVDGIDTVDRIEYMKQKMVDYASGETRDS